MRSRFVLLPGDHILELIPHHATLHRYQYGESALLRLLIMLTITVIGSTAVHFFYRNQREAAEVSIRNFKSKRPSSGDLYVLKRSDAVWIPSQPPYASIVS